MKRESKYNESAQHKCMLGKIQLDSSHEYMWFDNMIVSNIGNVETW